MKTLSSVLFNDHPLLLVEFTTQSHLFKGRRYGVHWNGLWHCTTDDKVEAVMVVNDLLNGRS